MIALVPLAANSRIDLAALTASLSSRLRQQVSIVPATVDPELFYDSRRRQYNSSSIVHFCLQRRLPGADKTLIVTGLDLFIPILTFVFGEAQLNGPCAVVSAFRLDPAYYGLPADPELAKQRILKEAVHELGHCYGLIHCRNRECVMKSSTYAEEIDLKPAEFCAECRPQFEAALAAIPESAVSVKAKRPKLELQLPWRKK